MALLCQPWRYLHAVRIPYLQLQPIDGPHAPGILVERIRRSFSATDHVSNVDLNHLGSAGLRFTDRPKRGKYPQRGQEPKHAKQSPKQTGNFPSGAPVGLPGAHPGLRKTHRNACKPERTVVRPTSTSVDRGCPDIRGREPGVASPRRTVQRYSRWDVTSGYQSPHIQPGQLRERNAGRSRSKLSRRKPRSISSSFRAET